MTKIPVFLLLVLLAVAVSGMAEATPSPDVVIEQTSNEMVIALDENREAMAKDPARIYELIDRIVLPRFDIETIARQTLGKVWRTASPGQRERFKSEFQTFIMNTYAKQIVKYSDQRLKVDPVKAEALNSRYVTVHSQIITRNTDPISINYRLYLKDGEWKIFDFTVEGVSLVINYRNSFANEIRKGGLEALIERLAARNAQFKLEEFGNPVSRGRMIEFPARLPGASARKA